MQNDALAAAIHAVAELEMNREGKPYSRTQEEFYEDAAETVEAVLAALSTRPSASVGLREPVRDYEPIAERVMVNAARGLKQRCPACGVTSERVDDVDAHIASQ